LIEGSGSVGAEGGGEVAIQPKKNFLLVLWEFSRPHTIIGSVLSIVSLHLFAASAPGLSAINLSALSVAMAWALACGALINLYVTGLNQLFDIDIDKVNKPYLPIPAGYLSEKVAWISVLAALVLGTVPIALWYPYAKLPLLATTIGSALLGTAYSAPPVRLKRFPLLAAFCIIVVRGTLINLGFYAHAASVIGAELFPLRSCLAATYFALFGVVIATMKDVPDVKGDRLFQVRTFSVRIGARRILEGSTWTLAATLALTGCACIWGVWSEGLPLALRVCRGLVAAAALSTAVYVRRSCVGLLERAGDEDSETFSKEVFAYYMGLWKIFYASYILLPLAILGC